MDTYPIVNASFLEPPASRGLFGMGRKIRDVRELPRPGAHQVLVYRVDGRYVVDRGELSPDDDQVTRASHVSMVDVTAGVPVTAQLTIPSADSSEFTMRVTFACTVTDPARVVRENLNAQATILGYLRRHQKVMHLGMRHGMADINQVRRDVSARIRAYVKVKPLEVPGVRMVLAGVEVLTPAEVAALAKALREARAEHVLQVERQGHKQEQEFNEEHHTQRLADTRRRARHAEAEEDQENTQLVELRKRRHERRMRAEELEFARREVEQAVDAIGGDPIKALVYAQSLGEINAKELAERMLDERHRDEEQVQKELDWERQNDRQQLDWDREDRRRREQEEREDRQRVWQAEREDRTKQLDINMELLRELARRGHLDMVNVKLERLLEEVSGQHPGTLSAAGREALPNAEGRAPIEAGRPDGDTKPDRAVDEDDEIDVEVREEDD